MNNLKSLMNSLPESVIAHIQYLERMRQDFVTNVSHELRTPLTVIHGYLEILADSKDDNFATYHHIITSMQQQTNRMITLIENLLMLSRLDHDELTDQPQQEIAIADLLDSIITEASYLINEKKQSIILNTDRQLKLFGVEDELRSLFSNIIFNAIKYTPENGKINISWYHSNKKAYFSVEDNGIGIEAKHISRLTERFYRVDKGRSRESGGTGLGLAIAKHVLIRHNAQLDIKSTPGEGSIFTCIFNESRISMDNCAVHLKP